MSTTHKYIYQSDHWPAFVWDKALAADRQSQVMRKAGHLFGRLHDIGLDTQLRTMTENITGSVVDSYSIEGIVLDTALRDIRDLVARGLLRPLEGMQRNVEYEIMIESNK